MLIKTIIKYFISLLKKIKHYAVAVLSYIIYRNPSKELVVIGVTGTKGKTTTARYLHSVLSKSLKKVGLISTAYLSFNGEIELNNLHMTMPGNFFINKAIRKMVDNGCEYLVLEVSSDGILQYRDFGVQYDSVIFTNLSREHMVTHKTLDNYKETKGLLFKRFASRNRKKVLNNKEVNRYSLINKASDYSQYFSSLSISKISENIFYGIDIDEGESATIVDRLDNCIKFKFKDREYKLNMIGDFFVSNCLPAIILSKKYENISDEDISDALLQTKILGRVEEIKEGQDFRVFVDYAHEPLSIREVLKALNNIKGENNLIAVVGAVGGGRYIYNAKEIGKEASNADKIVITDIDPFFDNPKTIASLVNEGVSKEVESYTELDRRKGINLALSLAKKGDIVVVTGKGAETTMIVNGETLPFSDIEVIKEGLKKIN